MSILHIQPKNRQEHAEHHSSNEGELFSPKPWTYTLDYLHDTLAHQYPNVARALAENYDKLSILDQAYIKDMDTWVRTRLNPELVLATREARPYSSLKFAPNPTHMLFDTPTDFDCVQPIIKHSKRHAWHVSLTRDFAHSYKTYICSACKDYCANENLSPTHQEQCIDSECGKTKKKYAYLTPDFDGEHSHKTQIHHHRYAVLNATNIKRFIVVDIDTTLGLNPSYSKHDTLTLKSTIHPHTYNKIDSLTRKYGAPNYVGVNMENGHVQLIFFIHDVYHDKTRTSKPIELYKTVSNRLTNYFDADTHFTGGFSRNPLYSKRGEYQWFFLHDQVYDLIALDWALYKTTGITHAHGASKLPSAYINKNDTHTLITQVRHTQASIANTLPSNASDLHSVRVPQALIEHFKTRGLALPQHISIKKNNATISRNDTTFTYCLKATYQLATQGYTPTDNDISTIWNQVYTKICTYTGNHASLDVFDKSLPNRLRDYVKNTQTQHKRPLTASEREQLVCAGRKGGRISAQRRWANTNETNPQILQARHNARTALATHATQRAQKAEHTRSIVKKLILSQLKHGIIATTAHIAHQLGLNTKTVDRYRKQIELTRSDIKKLVAQGVLEYGTTTGNSTESQLQEVKSLHHHHITVGGEGNFYLPLKNNKNQQLPNRHSPPPPPDL